MIRRCHFLFLLQKIIAIVIERIPSTNPFPTERQFSLMEIFPDLNIFVLYGGYVLPSSTYNDLWSFNLIDSIWEKNSPNDEKYPGIFYVVARYCGGSFALQNSSAFCIFGGASASGPLNDIWCFYILESIWKEIKTSGEIPSSRVLFAYTSWVENDVLYFVIYGGNSMLGLNNEMFKLDTASWTWTKMKQYGDIPPLVNSPNIVHHNNILFLVATEIGKFYKYDLTTEIWTNATSKNSYEARLFSNSLIFDDKIYLMPGWSSSLNEDISEWYKLDIDDPFYEWSKVELNQTDYDLDSYGYILLNSKIYIFGGYRSSQKEVVNNLAIFNLETSPIELIVHDKDIAPDPRMLHQIQPIGGYLILFGGIGENQKILNDMWAFDCKKEKWEALRPSGSSPTGRYGYASSSNADVMMIWGGIGASGLLNDGYTYDLTTNTFYLWDHSENIPSPREGACIAVSGQLIAIYGGLTSAGLSDELWIYNAATKEYTLLDSGNVEGPGSLSYASCVINSHLELYVMFGMQKQDALSQVFKYSFKKHTWTDINHNRDDPKWSRAYAGVVKLNERVLVVGGQFLSISQNQQIFYLNITSNEFMYIGELEECAYSFAYAYYQNYFYIHGGGSAINDIAKSNIPTNKFFRIHLDFDDYWACSTGTYKSDKCEICLPGTYSDTLGAKECLECWKGYYNPHYGASSSDMCYPCPEDTYNIEKGKAECLDCPSSTTCKAGTINYEINDISVNDISYQPSNYESDMGQANTATFIVQIILGIIGFFTILIVVIFKSSRDFLAKIDLYTTYHNNTIGKAMYLLKTKFGGAFTLIFIVLAFIIILDAMVTYSMNNIMELKSMIPLVVLDSMTEFKGNFQIKTTLMHYGGWCLDGTVCSSEIGYTIYNITGHWSGITCEFVNQLDCEVSIECKNCSVLNQGQINFQMINSNGFTSGYRIQINSSSSIPDEISSMETTVYPNKNYIFLGSYPTTIYFSLIPSWYKNEKDGVSSTGFHIALDNDASLGSMHKTNEVGISYNSYLNIQFDKALNGLVTNRSVIQTPIALLSSLLGSVFGLMSSVGAVMQIVEKKWKEIEAKYSKKLPYAIAKNNSKTILQVYENNSIFQARHSRIDSSCSVTDSRLTLSYSKA